MKLQFFFFLGGGLSNLRKLTKLWCVFFHFCFSKWWAFFLCELTCFSENRWNWCVLFPFNELINTEKFKSEINELFVNTFFQANYHGPLSDQCVVHFFRAQSGHFFIHSKSVKHLLECEVLHYANRGGCQEMCGIDGWGPLRLLLSLRRRRLIIISIFNTRRHA